MAEAVATTASDSPDRALSSRPQPWLRWLGTAGSVFVGAVLLFATWAKAIHPDAFVEAIASRGLTFGIGAAAVAFVALALEAGLGMLLLLDVRRLWVLIPAALLVAFFLFLTGQDYYYALRGIEHEGASCGCFGNLVERTPAQAFWQDLVLLVPGLALAFVARPRGGRTVPPVRAAIAALVVVGTIAFAWKAPGLPLDDYATRLSPGVDVAKICAGEGTQRVCLDTLAPGLVDGEHLVILTELDEPFGERVEVINRYLDARLLDAPEAPGLEVFTTTGPSEGQAFYWQWGPGFEPHEVPPTLMVPLYRRLPRSFLVRDGEVVETWNGLPPFERWAPTMNDQIAAQGG